MSFLFSGGGIATTMLVTFHLRTRRCAIVFYLWNWAKIDGSTNFFYAAKLDPKLGNIRRHTEPESKEPRYNCHQNMIKLPDSFPTQTKMSFSVMFLRNFGTPCRWEAEGELQKTFSILGSNLLKNTFDRSHYLTFFSQIWAHLNRWEA